MSKILIIDFFAVKTHLETSFEIVQKHLDSGDEVHYSFIGHEMPFNEGLVIKKKDILLNNSLPERKIARLISGKGFKSYFDDKINSKSNNIKFSFSSIDDLMSYTVGDCELGVSTASTLLFYLRQSDPDLTELQNIKIVNDLNTSGLLAFDYSEDMILKVKPDLVYIFNGRFSKYRSLMNACKKHNVPYLIHERGSTIHKYSLRPFMPHDMERLQKEMVDEWGKSNNDTKLNTAKKFYESRRNGVELNWFSFVKDQIKGKLPIFDNGKKIITYFSSSDDEFKAIGDIVKWKYWLNQIDAIQSLIMVTEKMTDVQLVIRIHPHISHKSEIDKKKWNDISKNSKAILIKPEDDVDTYALIERSDVVVTCGSTVGIEAVYWGRPSVLMGPSFYSNLNAVHTPRDEDELIYMLKNKLPVNKEGALIYGYYMANFGIDFQYYKPVDIHNGLFKGVDIWNSIKPQNKTLLILQNKLLVLRNNLMKKYK